MKAKEYRYLIVVMIGKDRPLYGFKTRIARSKFIADLKKIDPEVQYATTEDKGRGK